MLLVFVCRYVCLGSSRHIFKYSIRICASILRDFNFLHKITTNIEAVVFLYPFQKTFFILLFLTFLANPTKNLQINVNRWFRKLANRVHQSICTPPAANWFLISVWLSSWATVYVELLSAFPSKSKGKVIARIIKFMENSLLARSSVRGTQQDEVRNWADTFWLIFALPVCRVLQLIKTYYH